MNVVNNSLELIITDKNTGEDWQCNYDAAFIENLTQKTGNFKQFDIFINMLKSGILNTSSSICLDMMTFEDLDNLRNKGIRGSYSSYHTAQSNSNRRYLILTYTVEFDRIHYPLPLEYCGLPNPRILQSHIKKLEEEIVVLKDQLSRRQLTRARSDAKLVSSLQKRIEVLTIENEELYNENQHLHSMANKKPRQQIRLLEDAIQSLEKSVIQERQTHHELVEKLKNDKMKLNKELTKLRDIEKTLRHQIRNRSGDSEQIRKPSESAVNIDRFNLTKRSGSADSNPTKFLKNQRLNISKTNSVNRSRSRKKSIPVMRSASENSPRNMTSYPKFTVTDSYPNEQMHPRKCTSCSRSSSTSSYASSVYDRKLTFRSKSSDRDVTRNYNGKYDLGTVNDSLLTLRKFCIGSKHSRRF